MLARKELREVGGSEEPCTPLIMHTGPGSTEHRLAMLGLEIHGMHSTTMRSGPCPMPFPHARCPFDPDERT